MGPEAGALRLARGASTALVCTILAGGAHVSAGGRASTTSLVVVFLGTWAVAFALAGRRLATTQLVGLLLLGQALTHVVSPPAAEAGSDFTMLLAHVVGTALSAVLLRRGEDALWTLADRIVLRAVYVASAATPTPWRASAVLIASNRTHRPLLLTHVIEGRGPPAGLT